MSENINNASQVGHQNYIGNIYDVNEPHANDPHNMGGICFIFLPLAEGNTVFHIKNIAFQLL